MEDFERWLEFSSIFINQELARQAWNIHCRRLEASSAIHWRAAVNALPEFARIQILNNPKGPAFSAELDSLKNECLFQNLKVLKPWRKGPWFFDRVQVDCEWDSSLKWQRVEQMGLDLQNKSVADLGCGNGYYMYQMLKHNPKFVMGLDPSVLFHCQFLAMQKYLQDPRLIHLTLSSDDILSWKSVCDVLFCMGVLYHRRSPLDFLDQLRPLLKRNGKLVLETLILLGDEDLCLSPIPSYGKMKNCFFLPTRSVLEYWLERTGWKVVQWGSLEPTLPHEQRKTDWLEFQSLEDFLDPMDPSKTIEGYQAPWRQILIAEAQR